MKIIYHCASNNGATKCNDAGYLLAVSFELVERVFRVTTATLGHRHTLEVRHKKTDGGLQFFDVRAFHLFDNERWTRTILLQ